MPKHGITDATRLKVIADLARCPTLYAEGKLDEARDLAENIAEYAKRMGIRSAHLLWNRAILADYAHDLVAALKLITAAVEADPFDPNFNRSKGIIVDRVREALADPERDLRDPSTVVLHKLLVQASAADAASHLALASHLNAVGKHAQALAVVEAVITLSPSSEAAYRLKAAIALATGDKDTAVTASAEAAACAPSSIPFFDGAVVAQA